MAGAKQKVSARLILAGAVMSLLTLTLLRELIETDLSDDALQLYLDDAEAEIIKRYGLHGESGTEVVEDEFPASKIYDDGRNSCIYLSRPASTISSVVEREDDVETTLSSNDYRIIHNGVAVERLTGGTNKREAWAPEVRITYLPVSQLATRKRVQRDLVQLAIQYKGLISEQTGDYSASMDVYQTERNRILAVLETGRLLV